MTSIEQYYNDDKTELTLPYNFNEELMMGQLYESLTHLTFGEDYNQKIKENILPFSIYIKP